MNAYTVMPVTIPLQRPLWRRVAAWAAERLSAVRDVRDVTGLVVEPMDLRTALTINDHLLRDIGVSEALRDEAAARRSIESMAAHIAQQDFAPRGQHWYG
jgi:hypothetical protein